MQYAVYVLKTVCYTLYLIGNLFHLLFVFQTVVMPAAGTRIPDAALEVLGLLAISGHDQAAQQ